MQGAPSDIVFELVEIQHSYFKRNGNDLETSITITLEEVHFVRCRPFWVSQK